MSDSSEMNSKAASSGAADQRRIALEVIGQVSGKPASGLQPQDDLVADLGIESPEALRMLVELEERLGVEITDEEAAAMNSVGDILAYVDRVAG